MLALIYNTFITTSNYTKLLKKSTFLLPSFILLALFAPPASAGPSLIERLNGKILLQVEDKGQAWYINPSDLKKYSLGKPSSAFKVMQEFGTGITNANLAKIPIGIITSTPDSDKDGLPDSLENALGTNPNSIDSDQDGFSDTQEIINNFNPTGSGIVNINETFTKNASGKIFIQVENHGQAWYINPTNNKRYYLGRPHDALNIMRTLGLGITNSNLNKIVTGNLIINNIAINTPTTITQPIQVTTASPNPIITNTAPENNPKNQATSTPQTNTARTTLNNAATAIRRNNKEEAVKYFIPGLKVAIERSLDSLEPDGRLMLSNLLSALSYKKTEDNLRIYSAKVWFGLGGFENDHIVKVEQQANGEWLISSL